MVKAKEMRRGLTSLAILALAFLLLTTSLGGFASNPGKGNVPLEEGKGNVSIETENLTLIVYNSTHVTYIRTAVFGSYSEGNWIPVNPNYTERWSIFEPSVPHHAETDRITIKASFVINGTVPLPLNTLSMDRGVYRYRNSGLFIGRETFTNYTFTAVTYSYSFPVLLNLTPGNLSDYLSIPRELRDAVEGIVSPFNGTGLGKYAELMNVQYYLLVTKKYEENATFPPGTDRVLTFLTNASTGSAYDFASALVFLARGLGIPARLVKGYEILPNPEPQVVNVSRPTYWVEVYFKGTGWLPVDPFKPYPGQYLPFTATARPEVLNLTPGSKGELRFLLLDVKGSAKPVDVSAISPLNLSVSRGRYSVNASLRAPAERGMYPIALTDGEKFRVYTGAYVNVSSDVEVPHLVTAVPGSTSIRYSLLVHSTNVSVEGNPWMIPISTIRVGNHTEVWFAVSPPDNASLGLHLLKIKLRSENLTEVVYVPVYVMDIPKVDVKAPNGILVGRPFEVSGNVTGTVSKGKPNGEVLLFSYMEEWPLIGVGNVTDGKFNFTALFPPETDPGLKHLDLFFYWDGAMLYPAPYMRGATFVPMMVLQQSRFNVTRLVITRPGEFHLTGKLEDMGGRGIGNATVKYSWDATNGNVTTKGEGLFTLNLNVTKGEHFLLLIYWGNELYNFTITPVRIYGVVLQGQRIFKGTIGKPIKVSGLVDGMKNGTLQLVYGNESENVSVVNGSFSVTVGPFKRAGEYTLYVWGTDSIVGTLQVAVVSPVVLSVKTERLVVGKNETLVITARDSLGNSVAGIPLHILMPGFNGTIYTDGKGKVLLFPKLKEPGRLPISVSFYGSTFYLPAKTEATVEVVKPRSPWPYALPGFALALILLVMRGRGRREEEPEGGGILIADGVPVVAEDEEFTVELLCDGELIVDGKSVGRGRRFRLRLKRGLHEIEARCEKRRLKTTVESYGSYAEAVRRLYEERFLGWASTVLRTDSLTPREIEKVLAEKVPQPSALRTIRETFEVSEYGTGNVDRPAFVTFYRALKRVVGT
jgi:hypothetical protein